MLGYFVVYQQVENHLLQPLIYGRTVRSPPLAILISVLRRGGRRRRRGARGDPAGGTIQILLEHWQASRRACACAGEDSEPDEPRAERPARTRKRVALP